MKTDSDSDNEDINNNTIPIKSLYYSLKKFRRNKLYVELFYYIIFLGMFLYFNINIMDINTAYK